MKFPFISSSYLTYLFLAIIISYRIIRLLIATQEIHGLELISLSDLNLIMDLLTVFFIGIILFFQRDLSGYLYFGLFGILIIGLINLFSFQSEYFSPLKTGLQLITIIGTIFFSYFLLKPIKTEKNTSYYKIYVLIFTLYSSAIFFSAIDRFVLFSSGLSNYLGIVTIICVLCLGLIMIYFLVISYSHKITPIGTIILGSILGIGFSMAFGRGDLRRLIARSIFSESTSFEMISIFDISIFNINVSQIIDFFVLIITAIIFSSFILLIILNFVQKKRKNEYLAILVILGLITVDVLIPILLFLRLYALPRIIDSSKEPTS